MKARNHKTQMFKILILGGALAWLVGGGMVACDPKTRAENYMERGSLRTDGTTLHSSTTFGGMATQIAVQRINLIGVDPLQFPGGSVGINPVSNMQSLSFDLTLNREIRTLTTPLAIGNYGQFYNINNGYNVVQMSSYFQVSSQAACYMFTCDEVVLGIYIQSYFGEDRMIAIRKNMREDRIVNINEYNDYVSLDRMMREL